MRSKLRWLALAAIAVGLTMLPMVAQVAEAGHMTP